MKIIAPIISIIPKTNDATGFLQLDFPDKTMAMTPKIIPKTKSPMIPQTNPALLPSEA